MRRNTPILAPLNDDRRRGSAQAGPSDDPIARRGPVPAIDGDAAKPNGVSSASNDASSPPVTPPRTANQPPSATEGTQLLDDSPRAGPGGLEATVLSTRLDALDAAQRETAQRLDATSILLSIMARLDQLAPPAEQRAKVASRTPPEAPPRPCSQRSACAKRDAKSAIDPTMPGPGPDFRAQPRRRARRPGTTAAGPGRAPP